MATIVIDTYSFVSKLKASGMDEAQAKALAESIRDLDLSHVATKQDLQVTVAELKADLFKWFIPLMLGQYGLLIAVLMKLH